MPDDQTQTTIDPEPGTNPAPTDPTPEPTPTPDPETPTHWSRSEGMNLDDDTVGWLENKGFESPQAAITSQRELEKKLGGPPEMLLKWPQADDTDGFRDVFRRLGTPEAVEGYKIEFDEGAAVDPDTLTWFKEKALAHNMTNAQVQGMAVDWNAEVVRMQTEQQEALDVQDKIEETELRTTWGPKYEERLDYGHRALLALGFEEEDIDSMQGAIGLKKLATYAAKMADTMGEDTIAENTSTPSFGTSVEQVQNKINEKMSELSGDTKRYDQYLADHSDAVPPELKGKDYREMQILWKQLEGLGKQGG